MVMALCCAEGHFVEIGGGTKFDSMRGGWCSKHIVGPFEVVVWNHIREWRVSRVL